MRKHGFIFIFLLGHFVCSYGQPAVGISGKLRVMQPVELRLESLSGQVIFSVGIGKQGEFDTGTKELTPDVYKLVIGGMKKYLYLDVPVTIKGFYDAGDPANSTFDLDGIYTHLEICKWLPDKRKTPETMIDAALRQHLSSSMISALAYLADIPLYEPNRLLLNMIPEGERGSLSARWLERRVDSLAAYAVGAEAYDFACVDTEGKTVSLSDFHGKYVLIDFWASWCGPCRREMKSLLPIYEELKGDDLVFISISLDNREQDWRRAMEEEGLPWVMLRHGEGFPAGEEPNTIQRAYGFFSIPFIVLIDKEGRLLHRGLRGEQVRKAIIGARGK